MAEEKTCEQTLITRIDQVNTAWLTHILTRSGALSSGSVQSYELGTGQGNWSTSVSLRLTYTPDAGGECPHRLFLKMVDTDTGDGESFGDSEVTYYARDYVDVPHAPLLRCYDACYVQEQGRYHLLLEDVSETHIEAAEKTPNLEYGLALAEGLAALHARWWGANGLSHVGSTMHSASHIQRYVDIAAPGVAPILSRFSHTLKPEWHGTINEIFREHPGAIIRRASDTNGFTIIHGDVGCGNVLVPRQGDRPIYIIDRQPFNWSLTVWLGVYDLAYAMVLDWDTEIRRQYELPILKHYHEHLIRNGVQGYDWKQLYADYRLCVVMGVYIAVEYCRGGVNEAWTHVWLPMLKRTLTAIEDLQCQSTWK
jgi:hypothetical protein